jgi:hypothetical protein
VVAAAIRARRNPLVIDEYGATGSFAIACRHADAERHSKPIPHKHDKSSLLSSTAAAIDFLLKQKDEQRLAKFLEGRPSEELDRIENYIARKMS